MTPAAAAPALEPLRKKLAGKDPPRVVAAVGPDAWLREAALRTVAEVVLGDAESPDLVTVRAAGAEGASSEDALARFFDEARTSSLFGGAKVVALRDAELGTKADRDAVVAWLAAPSSSVTAVLVAEDLPAEVMTAAAAAGVVVRCGGKGSQGEPPVRFVARQAAARGKRLGGEEAKLLVELVGDDLAALENAVEVLSLHAGDDPAIDAAAIRALFPGARQGEAEEFARALLDGRAADALAAASRCFDEGVPEAWGSSRIARDERGVAFVLARTFSWSLQRLLEARAQLDAGVPRGEIRLSGPPWMRDQVVGDAARRRTETLVAMTLLYEETDRGMKSGGPTGRVAIARLATAAGRVAAR